MNKEFKSYISIFESYDIINKSVVSMYIEDQVRLVQKMVIDFCKELSNSKLLLSMEDIIFICAKYQGIFFKIRDYLIRTLKSFHLKENAFTLALEKSVPSLSFV